MNPYRKQAVDWLLNFADLAEGKSVNGIAGNPDGDPRVGQALRIAAQQIEGLPHPVGAGACEHATVADPKPALEDTVEPQTQATRSEPRSSGDLAQQIAAKSDEEMDQAMAASVPLVIAPNEDV